MTPILMTFELLRSALSHLPSYGLLEQIQTCRQAIYATTELRQTLNNGYIILTDPSDQAQNKGQIFADLTPENRAYIQHEIERLRLWCL